MENEKAAITPTEWRLMECLWAKSPRTGREAVEYMQEREGWSRSTTLTLLRRMTEKGILRCDEKGEVREYFPELKREDAVQRETRSFLNRVYRGSVGLLVSSMVEEQELSQEEIDQLYAVLKRAEEGKSND